MAAQNMGDVVIKLLERQLKDAQAALKNGTANNAPNIKDLEKAVEDAKKALDKYKQSSGSTRSRLNEKYLGEYYDKVGDWVRDLVKQFPDLMKLFSKAVSNGWDANRFISELYKSDWWKEQKDKGRGTAWLDAFVLENDPAKQGEWIDTLDAVKAKIRRMADEIYDLKLDDVDLDKIARRYLYQGWSKDDERGLRVWLDRQVGKRDQAPGGDVDGDESAGGYQSGGQLADKERQLRDAVRRYGLDRSEAWIKETARAILNPGSGVTEDDVWNEFIREAEAKYPVFGGRLSRDRSVFDLADGYMMSLSKMLEIDYDSLDLSDPLLQRAFTNLDENNNPKLMPLWEFSKQIREDERWQYTDNARDSYMSAASKFARSLGLAG